ncbi:MAG: accessory factor UbiK family protein [Phycisphaeraceae bacterium]
MLDNDAFRELSQRLSALLPAASGMRDEVRTKIEQTLKQGFKELNLLTQDEFQVQADSLQRAQQRINDLELEIRELESRLETLESGR